MPVNDTTANRSYQKPNIANTLSDDVGRLRSALDAIDTDMASKAPSAGPTFTEVTTVAAGSAAAPSLTFTGATSDTGLYSPGADQVAISTGGTGRVFVDSVGNIGINTNGPQAYTGYKTLELSDTTGGVFRLRNIAGTAALEIAANATESYIANTAAVPLTFKTSNTERLRITSDGNVGIGTSSPRSSLDVTGTTDITWAGGADAVKGLLTVGTQGTAGGSLFVHTPSLSASYGAGFAVNGSYSNPGGIGTAVINLKALGVYSNGGYDSALAFHTSSNTTSAERLRITGDGKVGIGTSLPQGQLSLGSAAGVQIGLTLDWTGAGGPYQIAGLTADRNTGEIRQYAYTNFFPTFYANGSERARIDTSGRLLVGTSSDSGGALLQVNGDRIRVGTAKTPASATATGTTGEVCWDANYIYVCTATNTWKRTAIASW